MLALVTGATGFVGANVVEALNRAGWQVRALHRPTSSSAALKGLAYQPVQGDVLAPETLRAAMQGCDAVFHVAAVADYWQQPRQRLYQVNVEGTDNVLEAALAVGTPRLVHTSSQAALGFARGMEPVDESRRFNLAADVFPYGHSKHLAELAVQAAVERGLHAVIVNPAVVIGPRDVNLNNSRIIIEVHKRSTPLLPPGGISVVDAADVAAGHLLALEKGRPGERYLLTGHNVTNLQFAQEIAAVLGVRPPWGNVPRALVRPLAGLVDGVGRVADLPLTGEILRLGALYFYADRSKAARELGLPLTPLRQTIGRAVDWLRSEGRLPRLVG